MSDGLKHRRVSSGNPYWTLCGKRTVLMAWKGEEYGDAVTDESLVTCLECIAGDDWGDPEFIGGGW